jgi:hypothetical protein
MPAELCFLDVNTIVYHDRNWGTHLYDIEMKADLGGILYAAPALTRLFCRDKTVCGYYNGMYITENVDMLLPASSPASNKIIKAYRDTSDESDDGNVLRSILKKNEYLVECIIDTTEGGYDVVFDGATRLFVGEKQRTDEILEGITDTMGFYSDKYISYVGKPTVLGILNNGHSAVVAASDGSFYELSFNEENGGCLVNSHKQIPTHAAIEEVILCEDYYYLKDTNGYYWKSRIGYTNEYYSDYFEEVKDKIHCAVEDELLEIISPYVAKELELKKLPGGGLEVWE